MGQHVPAVGIDLGTTYSSVAIFHQGRVQVVSNEYGERLTPSCVAFETDRCTVGKEARDDCYIRPKNTICAPKRIIGRKFDEQEVQSYAAKWPGEIVPTATGIPQFGIVDAEYIVRHFDPEDVSSFLLAKLRDHVKSYLGCSDNLPLNAVITVPAHFKDSQRRATKRAGEKAGLNVLSLVNEPTAAAVAFGFGRLDQTQTILVFDLGGGKLDVSVIRITDGRKFEVLATCGNNSLGGKNFDERLLDYFISQFEEQHNVTVDRLSEGVARLRLRVEQIKKSLTKPDSKHLLHLEAFYEKNSLTSSITTAKFDQLCEDLFVEIFGPIEEAIKLASLQKSEIDQVVLAGGGSRVLKIRKLLSDYFLNGIKIVPFADGFTAGGAAILAHQLAAGSSDCMEELPLEISEVTPYSLCVEAPEGAMTILLPRNTKIPVKETKSFTTERKGCKVEVPIYEGDNRLLGWIQFENSEVEAGPTPVMQIDALLEYDRSGIVHLAAMKQIRQSEDAQCGDTVPVQLAPETQCLIPEPSVTKELSVSDISDAAPIDASTHHLGSRLKLQKSTSQGNLPFMDRVAAAEQDLLMLLKDCHIEVSKGNTFDDMISCTITYNFKIDIAELTMVKVHDYEQGKLKRARLSGTGREIRPVPEWLESAVRLQASVSPVRWNRASNSQYHGVEIPWCSSIRLQNIPPGCSVQSVRLSFINPEGSGSPAVELGPKQGDIDNVNSKLHNIKGQTYSEANDELNVFRKAYCYIRLWVPIRTLVREQFSQLRIPSHRELGDCLIDYRGAENVTLRNEHFSVEVERTSLINISTKTAKIFANKAIGKVSVFDLDISKEAILAVLHATVGNFETFSLDPIAVPTTMIFELMFIATLWEINHLKVWSQMAFVERLCEDFDTSSISLADAFECLWTNHELIGTKMVLSALAVMLRCLKIVEARWMLYELFQQEWNQDTNILRVLVEPQVVHPDTEIFIKRSSGDTVKLVVHLSFTIVYVKVLIEAEEDLPVDLQRLDFCGRQLEDERTLTDYNIQQGSILNLIFRSR